MYNKLPVIVSIVFLYLIFTWAGPVHGLWVVRYALMDQDEIPKIISTAKELKITDLYVQVRALGKLYGQINDNPKKSSLGLLIQSAKKENIRVHAWINVLYIWAGDSEPKIKDHIYYPSINSIVRSGQESVIPNYRHLKKQGIEGFFIDPGDRYNLESIKYLISNLVINYGIDGIHLDYLRYPSLEYSFSPNGRTAFIRQQWFDPINLFTYKNDTISPMFIEKYQFISEMYKSFLREQVTNLLADINNYIRHFEKPLELSVAVKPNREIARNFYFQDWGHWLENNLCDHVLLMNYDTIMPNFMNNLSSKDVGEFTSKIIVGVSTYNQNEQAVMERIKYTQNTNAGGYAIFSYNYLQEHQTYFKILKSFLNIRQIK